MPTRHAVTGGWPEHDLLTRRDRVAKSLTCVPGPLAGAIAAHAADATRAGAGLWRRDGRVWAQDAATARAIRERLGWLDAPAEMAAVLSRLEEFTSSVVNDGFTHAVLLGMGGSSLAPEILRASLGSEPGRPDLRVLDSTDPAAIRAVEVPLRSTLFIWASKSGTTIEPSSLAAYYRDALERAGVRRWADHFVAITDEGTPLANRGRDEPFREVFINRSDVGGRYSALSYFGLVPAAIMGHDVRAIVGWGLAMLAAAAPTDGDVLQSPALGLGAALGAAALTGRDKLTLVLPAALDAFGLWVEQLIAESTGKAGVGVIPVAGETLGEPGAYGTDRLFVHVRLEGSSDRADEAAIADLRAAGAPLVILDVPEVAAIGGEFVRWEVATAVAGALLGINPFDEPNVRQAKDATNALLARYRVDGRLPAHRPDRITSEGVEVTVTAAARAGLLDRSPEDLLSLLRDGDYLAILAYLGPEPLLAAALQSFRMAARDRTKRATTLGYGPRYLHSTGQLHKGGPNNGVFVLITAHPDADVSIPHEIWSFATLELAQALGDFQSLDTEGRRGLHVHLPSAERRVLEPVLERLLAGAGA